MTADASEILDVLACGDVEVLGLLPYSSNYVFLARVCHDGQDVESVYKPRRGERPLWDFPHGTLAARELASYLVSEAGGWDLVPPTVLRTDAPMGDGSLQQFIEHDPELHYFVLLEERRDEFEQFAAYDIVINNADRKAGHVIEDADGKLWAVDHGLSFNIDDKLRTVIWEFAGEPIGEGVAARLAATENRLSDDESLGRELRALLLPGEVVAVSERIARLLDKGVYPAPDSNYRLPWPLV
jgi:uncharacterized repeat protein (TIGR03843 family)